MVLAILLFLAMATRISAFGALGHQMIAALAEDMLTPKAKAQVRSILTAAGSGGPAPDLAKVAVWADEVRGLRPETRPWHFVTLQIDEPGYQPARTDTPNVLTALEKQWALLRKPNVDRYVREEALKWVVHLVGDLHQPLHVGENHDRGGNLAMVKINRRSYKLHAIWDDVLLQRLNLVPDTLHALLAHELAGDPNFLARYAQGTVQAWVNETHAKSRNCYILHGKQMPKGIKVSLDKDYVRTATMTVLSQIKIASVRLAFVLNSAFDPSGSKISAPPKGAFSSHGPTHAKDIFAQSDSVAIVGRYVWSENSKAYHFSECKDAIRIKKKNRLTGDTPPPGLRLHAGCPIQR